MKPLKLLLLTLTVAILASGCTSKDNRPTEEDISKALIDRIGQYETVKDLEIVITEDVGSKVRPEFDSKFKGTLEVEESLYKEVDYILKTPVLKKLIDGGTEIKMEGVANSSLKMDKWIVTFLNHITRSIKEVPGYPLSNWKKEGYVIQGTDKGKALYAKKEKLEEELYQKKLRIIEKERKRIFAEMEAKELAKEKKLAAIKKREDAFLGIWKGTYECDNIPIGLTLTISRANKGFKAIFNYYPTEEPLDAFNGSYYVYGKLSTDGSFTFKPTEWIKRPKGHYMVGLQGKYEEDKGTLLGDIRHRGCGSLSLVRKNNQ